jgi:hypothetical protein
MLLLMLLLLLQVESDVYERVYQRCQNERMAQHRTYTWGNRCAAVYACKKFLMFSARSA